MAASLRSQILHQKFSDTPQEPHLVGVCEFPGRVDSSKGPHRVNRAHWPTKENKQKNIKCLIFSAHEKITWDGPKWGQGDFFCSLSFFCFFFPARIRRRTKVLDHDLDQDQGQDIDQDQVKDQGPGAGSGYPFQENY